MAGNGDRLGPVLHIGHDSFYQNGRPEYGSVQNSADGAVGTLPHLFQVIFFHPGSIGGDSGALYGHAVLQRGIGRVHRNLVIRGIAVLQTQVIVLCLEIDIGKQQLILYHLPEDPCHFVAVHLHQGSRHFYLLHIKPPD